MDEDIFYHHDARFNAMKIAQNLCLLQDHYNTDPCADCCLKHLQTVIAYAEEGLMLDNASMVRAELEEATDIADRHLKVILSCTDDKGTCKVRSQGDLDRMISEIRTLRRKLNLGVFGIHGDVTHDWVGEGGHGAHEHGHIGHNHAHHHDHGKLTGEELGGELVPNAHLDHVEMAELEEHGHE